MAGDLNAKVTALAGEWDMRALEMREDSVAAGLHPALARGHKEANLTARCAAELRAVLREGVAEPDGEFPATWAGGHALIIEFGDEELISRCQCGEPLGTGTPATCLDVFGEAWERHVMTRRAA
jgi:hypothetical protein